MLRDQLVDVIAEQAVFHDTVFSRKVQIKDGRQVSETRELLSPGRVTALFKDGPDGSDATTLDLELPARIGQESRMERPAGFASVLRVDREEEVTVPAGKFRCQVWVIEDRWPTNQAASVGLGLQVVPDGARVTSLAADSPAAAAGITPGAVLTDVDGAAIKSMALSDIIRRIRGVAGTTVQLTFQNPEGQARTVRVARVVQPVTGSTVWVAPKVGVVRIQRPGGLQVLSAVGSADAPLAEPGWVRLSGFENGDALDSPLFPKARWKSAIGGRDAISTCESDATTAANGSARSMRWAYHSKNHTWVCAEILPTGSWAELTDITKYDSVSFHIKAFKPQSVGFLWRGRPPGGGDFTFASIPVEATTEWKKVVISLNEPEWKKLDMTKVALISFFIWPPDADANVIWIDEINFHLRPGAKKS